MKTKKSSIAAFAAVALLSAGAAGAAMWWYGPALSAAPGAAAPVAEAVKKEPARYVTLDKVIVMLRRQPGETQAHYMSVDLVLSSDAENEKQTRDHLPLLRSVAVRSLSQFGLAKASTMTVEQFATELNHAFSATYAADGVDKPFSDVMIGKLIIE